MHIGCLKTYRMYSMCLLGRNRPSSLVGQTHKYRLLFKHLRNLIDGGGQWQAEAGFGESTEPITNHHDQYGACRLRLLERSDPGVLYHATAIDLLLLIARLSGYIIQLGRLTYRTVHDPHVALTARVVVCSTVLPATCMVAI